MFNIRFIEDERVIIISANLIKFAEFFKFHIILLFRFQKSILFYVILLAFLAETLVSVTFAQASATFAQASATFPRASATFPRASATFARALATFPRALATLP